MCKYNENTEHNFLQFLAFCHKKDKDCKKMIIEIKKKTAKSQKNDVAIKNGLEYFHAKNKPR